MVDALVDRLRTGEVATFWVDASVPYSTIVSVAYTLGRLGLRDYRFVFASKDGPRGLDVRPPVFPEDPTPVRAVRIDWAAHGGHPVAEVTEPGPGPCPTVLPLRPEMTTTYGELIAVATRHRPADACLAGLVIEAGP